MRVERGTIRPNFRSLLEVTKNIQSIFNFEQLVINPTPDSKNLQIYLDNNSYRLEELGSGLAQFIVVLINAAMKKPSYILIDEPELSLHPQLQIDFLTTLASYAKVGLFFCTHSYGLARATADSIYTVRKHGEANYSVLAPLETTDRLPELLGELSFQGYNDLGHSTVLLVEGVTDVRTMSQFLRIYGKDHEVVMLPLGGTAMINPDRKFELTELKRISNQIYALIDSEKATAEASVAPERTDFQKLCKKVGINCHILKRRATENYLSDRAVKEELGSNYESLGEYELLKDRKPTWSKNKNWRIARKMKKEEIYNTDLGEFLAEL